MAAHGGTVTAWPHTDRRPCIRSTNTHGTNADTLPCMCVDVAMGHSRASNCALFPTCTMCVRYHTDAAVVLPVPCKMKANLQRETRKAPQWLMA